MGVVRQMLTAVEARLETARPRFERRPPWRAPLQPSGRRSARLTSSFGVRADPFTAAASMHPGLDLDVELGDPVHVTADGVVIDARAITPSTATW